MTVANNRITLKNVRLSFPALFEPETFDDKPGKFAATFLIPKSDTRTKKILDQEIAKLIADKKIKVPSDKRCLKDGDESEYEGYADHWSIKAASKKRPTVIDRDKSQLADSDGVLYAGCYVNAIIDLWVQDNKYGKRVNANLYGVQFVKDGEAFGMGPVDVTDDFEDLQDLDDLESGEDVDDL